MQIKLFLLLIFGVCQITGESACNNTFRKLQYDQSEFVRCVVHNSVPATVCIKCLTEHNEMVTQYTELVTNCAQQYISQNRLDIVYNMEHYLESIWNKGFCNDCFDHSTTSKETTTFLHLAIVFNSCLNINVTAACKDCMDKYIELNDFFKEMEKAKKGKICFDVQDSMNRTRLKWSKELKCCHRDFNITSFLVGSSIFCVLPLIFYLGMYGYTKRMERNHELIDSTYGTAGHRESPSTSNAAIRPISTREAPEQEDTLKTVDLESENTLNSKDSNLPSTSHTSTAAALIEI